MIESIEFFLCFSLGVSLGVLDVANSFYSWLDIGRGAAMYCVEWNAPARCARVRGCYVVTWCRVSRETLSV